MSLNTAAEEFTCIEIGCLLQSMVHCQSHWWLSNRWFIDDTIQEKKWEVYKMARNLSWPVHLRTDCAPESAPARNISEWSRISPSWPQLSNSFAPAPPIDLSGQSRALASSGPGTLACPLWAGQRCVMSITESQWPRLGRGGAGEGGGKRDQGIWSPCPFVSTRQSHSRCLSLVGPLRGCVVANWPWPSQTQRSPSALSALALWVALKPC